MNHNDNDNDKDRELHALFFPETYPDVFNRIFWKNIDNTNVNIRLTQEYTDTLNKYFLQKTEPYESFVLGPPLHLIEPGDTPLLALLKPLKCSPSGELNPNDVIYIERLIYLGANLYIENLHGLSVAHLLVKSPLLVDLFCRIFKKLDEKFIQRLNQNSRESDELHSFEFDLTCLD